MAIENHTLRDQEQLEVSADQLGYSNNRLTGFVTNVENTLDYILAHLFPNFVGEFADVPSLMAYATPQANDYAFVLDDGDGKAAGYLYVSTDGSASWVKRLDVDWSKDTILADMVSQTNPLYVLANGRPNGQVLYGGTQTNENLELNANSADDTGEIILHNPLTPFADNEEDFGKLAQRIKDIYIAGLLHNGTDSVTIAQMKQAFDHLSVTSGNPHGVTYDELGTKLGSVTLNGDVGGSVDLSTSGNKTLSVTVSDDSHAHTTSTITGFADDVWDLVKAYFVDNDGITWTIDNALKTITPSQANITTAEIDDIDSPVSANKILASNGSKYSEKGITVSVTGDVSGSATYDTTTESIDITSSVDSASIKAIEGLETENLACTTTAGNPTSIYYANHKLQTGVKVYVKTAEIDGEFIATVLDANNFTIPTITVGAGAGFYIPNNGQFLYNSTTGKFEVRREFEEVTHTELGDVDLNDDHLQYVRKQGRALGQTIQGGLNASESLVLESTADSTKGNIVTKDSFIPDTDATYTGSWSGLDLGTASNRFRDIHVAGEFKGGRVENVSSLPTVSATKIGHIVHNTTDGVTYINDGTRYKPLASYNPPIIVEAWTGEETRNVSVASGLDPDKTTASYNWKLLNDTTSEEIHASITRLNATTLTITVEYPLTGSYTVKGF